MTTNRRLAAILAADVVGYSRLMGQDEAGTLEALKGIRAEIIDPQIAEHKGRVFKTTGDGVLAEFPSVVNAVECAVNIQRMMEDQSLELRIGINLGDVIVEGDDVFGDGVNIASRLEALADRGGIIISEKVHEEIGGKMSSHFESIGEQQLKNIARPIRVYRVKTAVRLSQSNPPLTLPDKPSIAVLPFQNMSGDPDQEYFGDGIAEEIITALSRMKWLFVIARNSSFTYKGRAVDIKQIGRELGVRYVLEGSVRKASAKVRITGQLIDAGTGTHLWADRFDGGIEDIFDLQDQVTANVVGAIGPKLEQAEIERAKRKPTDSLDAYDCYLRGMAAVHLWTREANVEAMSYFKRATTLDPNFASAYGMAARCYSQRKASLWTLGTAEDIAETEYLCFMAATLGRDDAVALGTAGIAKAFVAGDMDYGATMIGRALSIDPNYAWGWLFSAWVNVWCGESAEAMKQFAVAMRLSPQDPQYFNMQTGMAAAHFIAGHHEDAFSWATKALHDRAEYPLSNLVAAVSGTYCGRIAEAQRASVRFSKASPGLTISSLKDWFPLRQAEHRVTWEEGLRKAGFPE